MKTVLARSMRPLLVLTLIGMASSCTPNEQVELREVRNLQIRNSSNGPLVNGDVILYNPNHKRVKLKEINIELFVEGEKLAEVNQKFNQVILPEAEFSVPGEIQLAMDEADMMGTLFGLFGGKTYKVLYKGYIRISRSGFPIRIPIDYEEDFRLN